MLALLNQCSCLPLYYASFPPLLVESITKQVVVEFELLDLTLSTVVTEEKYDLLDFL
jgi:hypothetical protein